MKQRNLIIAFVALGAILLGGVWLYDWVLGDTLEASQPISAATLQIMTSTPTGDGSSTEEPSNTQKATEISPALAEVVGPTADNASSPLTIFQISQEESEVRFIIYEELRGQPKDVIGTSNQVAGEVAVDPSDLTTVKAGEIRINARTLVTDEDRRNQAIRNRILHTDQYEFITFVPTEIIGLSGSGHLGESYSFQIAGDLTIQDITQKVVFDATVQVISETRLEGFASATIRREDFNLIIPSVPFVANVGEEVVLEIDFVLIIP